MSFNFCSKILHKPSTHVKMFNLVTIIILYQIQETQVLKGGSNLNPIARLLISQEFVNTRELTNED